eukprot:g46492.t1
MPQVSPSFLFTRQRTILPARTFGLSGKELEVVDWSSFSRLARFPSAWSAQREDGVFRFALHIKHKRIQFYGNILATCQWWKLRVETASTQTGPFKVNGFKCRNSGIYNVPAFSRLRSKVGDTEEEEEGDGEEEGEEEEEEDRDEQDSAETKKTARTCRCSAEIRRGKRPLEKEKEEVRAEQDSAETNQSARARRSLRAALDAEEIVLKKLKQKLQAKLAELQIADNKLRC